MKVRKMLGQDFSEHGIVRVFVMSYNPGSCPAG